VGRDYWFVTQASYLHGYSAVLFIWTGGPQRG